MAGHCRIHYKKSIIRSGGKNFLLTVNIALIRLIKHKELINKPKQNVLPVTEACFLYEEQSFLSSSFHPERWGAVGSVHCRGRRSLISCLADKCSDLASKAAAALCRNSGEAAPGTSFLRTFWMRLFFCEQEESQHYALGWHDHAIFKVRQLLHQHC